jgi:hypothetical protein
MAANAVSGGCVSDSRGETDGHALENKGCVLIGLDVVVAPSQRARWINRRLRRRDGGVRSRRFEGGSGRGANE